MGKKIKFGHVGRPTILEKKQYEKKKILKIICLLSIFFMIIGSIFLFVNKDNIELKVIMGNSSYKEQMKKVQSSSNYTTIVYNPETYKNGYYYKKYGPYNKRSFISYLFTKTGYSNSKYIWEKIQIFSDGKYLYTYTTENKEFKISQKYVGKYLGLKILVKNKKTKKSYVKYLRLYVVGDIVSSNQAKCNFVKGVSNKNSFWWPIEISEKGKPKTTKISAKYSEKSHYGIDISGDTSVGVISAYDGEVYKVVNEKGNSSGSFSNKYGTYVIIKHKYKNETFYTLYAHMIYNSIPSNIRKGVKVSAGTKLGDMGRTGQNSKKGTRLHFEIRKGGNSEKKAVNPLDYISSSKPYPGGDYVCVSKTCNGRTKTINYQKGITYINDMIIVNKSYSLPSTYNPEQLLSEVTNAYNKMTAALKKEKNVTVDINSGFRSYNEQKSIYNNYVNTRGRTYAENYVARAGYSEHQSGLALDIKNSSDGTIQGNWLKKNAYKYGFVLRYLKNKENLTGYNYESWHYRYVGNDLAKILYNNGNWLTVEEYFCITSKY